MEQTSGKKRKILVVDDNKSIHQDIESILISTAGSNDEELREFEKELFKTEPEEIKKSSFNYEIDHAFQGEEAVEMVTKANENGTPYALIFMDVRMPPGIDGVQTIQKTWQNNPNVEVVICTAYSDYSWDQIMQSLGVSDKLLFMKKPFDATALKQTALTLTTKWHLQQESLNYTEKLEKDVSRRTAELEELLEAYKKLKEKAERATEAKSEFLANMSHEIRTPMNGIMAMNEMLSETGLTEEQREYCALVDQSAKALLRIINDILDLSKIEARKLDLEEIPLNLSDLLRDLSKIISVSAREKKINIEHSLDKNIPLRLMGDPTRIRQVLLNFGNNAVKFTEEGIIRFGAKLVEETECDVLIKFSVMDTGMGIPPEKVNTLFRPFSQADSSTTRKYGGTGLGLAICKQLAELMDGEVGVESKEAVGSTFWFTTRLKKLKTDPVNTLTGDPDNSDSDAIISAPTGIKILIAEDNKVNQIVLRRILEKEGYRFRFVDNGADALDQVKTGKFNLVLMDLQLPDMNGIEVTKKIREREEGTGRQIPIIALTASTLSEDKENCYQIGMNDFLTKPVNKEHLMTILSKWANTNSSDHTA